MKLITARYRLTLLVVLLTIPNWAGADGSQPPGAESPAIEGEIPIEGRTLSLAEATDRALRYSPELASDRAQAGAIAGRATQAAVWLNPQVDVMVENVAGSGTYEKADLAETTLTLAQPIELGGQRAKRQRIIALGQRRLEGQTQTHRLTISAEVHKRFLRVLLGQERRALTAEIERVSAEALRAIEGNTSGAALAERGQIRLVLSRSRLDARLAEQQIVAARRQLAAMWDDSETSFTAAGSLEEVAPPPPLEELVARLEHSPELARWDAEIERRIAGIALARADRVPGVTLYAGARHFNATDDFAGVFDIAVPLPLFDRNQGAILEAQQLLEVARADRDAAALDARTELLAAYDELRIQFERISQLGVDTIPQAKMASTEALEAYRRGSFNSTDVLATQRALFDLRDEYYTALAEYHAALVDVERLTTGFVGKEEAAR